MMFSSLDQLRTALDGLMTYTSALASGDVAPEDAQDARLAACIRCPSNRINAAPLGWIVGTCGEFNRPDFESNRPTCGCVVYVVEPGAAKLIRRLTRGTGRLPAGDDTAATVLEHVARPMLKAEVASQQCPQRRWVEPTIGGAPVIARIGHEAASEKRLSRN